MSELNIDYHAITQAINTLITEGKKRRNNDCSIGEAIGLSLTTEIVDSEVILDLLESSLQDMNLHLIVETIDSIRQGNYKKQGTTMTVNFPDYMETYYNKD